jgi:hypothetical protein
MFLAITILPVLYPIKRPFYPPEAGLPSSLRHFCGEAYGVKESGYKIFAMTRSIDEKCFLPQAIL